MVTNSNMFDLLSGSFGKELSVGTVIAKDTLEIVTKQVTEAAATLAAKQSAKQAAELVLKNADAPGKAAAELALKKATKEVVEAEAEVAAKTAAKKAAESSLSVTAKRLADDVTDAAKNIISKSKSFTPNANELKLATKMDDVAKSFTKASDDLANAKALNKGPKEIDALRKTMMKKLEKLESVEDLAGVAKTSVKDADSLLSKMKAFIEEYPTAAKALAAAGVSAAALCAIMLITGESNPFKAIGEATGEIISEGAKGVGSGIGALFEGLGIDTTVMYIGSGVLAGLCCLMFLLFILIK